jgi:hypothetical protein
MRWFPFQSTGLYGKRPEVGQIIAADFKAWRVIDVTDIPGTETGYEVRMIPLGVADPQRHMVQVEDRANFEVLPEHYAVCATCGDVVPCREVVGERRAVEAVEELERYDDPSVCPACNEVFTLRQKTITLPNVISPFGGEVTFHRRSRCLSSAASYEKRVAKITGRPLTLSCDGRLMLHRDGTLECLDLDCPDIHAYHGSYEQCRYRSHGCPRLECQLS